MDDASPRFWTRALLIGMIVTAIWGAWIIAKNGGQRAPIAPTEEKAH